MTIPTVGVRLGLTKTTVSLSDGLSGFGDMFLVILARFGRRNCQEQQDDR